MKKILLINPQNGGIIMTSENHPEIPDFKTDGYIELYSGTKRECEDFMEQYWDEHCTPDENRIFMKV